MPRKKRALVMPDVYENWLKTQPSGHVVARSGFIGDRNTRLGERGEDTEEDDIDRTEDLHEKAHRRKRGKGAAASGS